MKIGLIEIEKVVNTAYMQISQHHKQQGHEVEWWSPLEDSQFDMVYCSSLFDFTDKREVPARAIKGGTGFDLTTNLPPEIEACGYDYSIYPQCDYSIQWFSRGCNNKCPFCVVPQKEGKIRPVKPKNLNDNGKYIVVQDNSFFDNPEWEDAYEAIKGHKVELTNINVRTLTPEKCKAINSLKHVGQIKIAWDNPRQNILPYLGMLLAYVKPYKIMCYVLIGYWSTPEEDMHRVEVLRGVGIDPYAMPYNKKDPYQKRFARWVNHKAIFKTVKWEDYQ